MWFKNLDLLRCNYLTSYNRSNPVYVAGSGQVLGSQPKGLLHSSSDRTCPTYRLWCMGSTYCSCAEARNTPATPFHYWVQPAVRARDEGPQCDHLDQQQPQPGQHGAGKAGGQSADNSVRNEGNLWNDAEK